MARPCQHLAATQSGSPGRHQARRSRSYRSGRAVLSAAESPPSFIHLLDVGQNTGKRSQSPAHTSVASPSPRRHLTVVPLSPGQRYYGEVTARRRCVPGECLVCLPSVFPAPIAGLAYATWDPRVCPSMGHSSPQPKPIYRQLRRSGGMEPHWNGPVTDPWGGSL